jgi:hypothetical protein
LIDTDKDGIVRVGDTVVAEGYSVLIDFDDLPSFNGSPHEERKWLASFRNREDAEAYKSRKEREYR